MLRRASLRLSSMIVSVRLSKTFGLPTLIPFGRTLGDGEGEAAGRGSGCVKPAARSGAICNFLNERAAFVACTNANAAIAETRISFFIRNVLPSRDVQRTPVVISTVKMDGSGRAVS